MISIILHIFPARLKEIADGLGDDLWNMLAPITRREEIQQVGSGKKISGNSTSSICPLLLLFTMFSPFRHLRAMVGFR